MHIIFKDINKKSMLLCSHSLRDTSIQSFSDFLMGRLPYLCPKFTLLESQKAAEQQPFSEAAGHTITLVVIYFAYLLHKQ